MDLALLIIDDCQDVLYQFQMVQLIHTLFAGLAGHFWAGQPSAEAACA